MNTKILFFRESQMTSFVEIYRADDLDAQNISYIEFDENQIQSDLLGPEYVVPETVSTTDDLLAFCLAQQNT
jgi:hypothetical protein